jgi:hypothetical protein
MAYDPKNIKVEVDSLNKRHPRKGITGDIPDAAREQLEMERREREFTKGEKNRYAKGGSASSRADGIAQRGKTRGTMVACGGGYMKGKK